MSNQSSLDFVPFHRDETSSAVATDRREPLQLFSTAQWTRATPVRLGEIQPTTIGAEAIYSQLDKHLSDAETTGFMFLLGWCDPQGFISILPNQQHDRIKLHAVIQELPAESIAEGLRLLTELLEDYTRPTATVESLAEAFEAKPRKRFSNAAIKRRSHW